jgi:hypothetical protein
VDASKHGQGLKPLGASKHCHERELMTWAITSPAFSQVKVDSDIDRHELIPNVSN